MANHVHVVGAGTPDPAQGIPRATLHGCPVDAAKVKDGPIGADRQDIAWSAAPYGEEICTNTAAHGGPLGASVVQNRASATDSKYVGGATAPHAIELACQQLSWDSKCCHHSGL